MNGDNAGGRCESPVLSRKAERTASLWLGVWHLSPPAPVSHAKRHSAFLPVKANGSPDVSGVLFP